MPDRPEGLKELHRDLLCSMEPGNYLFILLCTENSWQNIKTEELLHWVEKSNRWAKYHNCSLMILNSANDTDKQLSPLLRQYRALSGWRAFVIRAIAIYLISHGGAVRKVLARSNSWLFYTMMRAGDWRKTKKRWYSRAATKNRPQ